MLEQLKKQTSAAQAHIKSVCACRTPEKAPQTSAELERSSFTVPSPLHVQYVSVWTDLIILSDGLKEMDLARGL